MTTREEAEAREARATKVFDAVIVIVEELLQGKRTLAVVQRQGNDGPYWTIEIPKVT